MMRALGALAITALLGAGLYLVVDHAVCTTTRASAGEPGVKPATGAPSNAPELAAIRQTVARLEAKVWADLPPAAAAEPTRAAPEEHDRDPRKDPEAREQQRRQHHEYMAGVDAAFRKEPVDPGWSSATSLVVRDAIAADADLRTLARGMECRSRTCRVELADDGSGKLSEIVPMFTSQIGRDLPSMVAERIDDGGTATMVLYLSRRDDAPAQ